MADKFLRYKLIEGSIKENPESGIWFPSNYANDFYPKYVGDKTSGFTKPELIPFEQKDEFKSLMLMENQIFVEPPVSSWGINFENLIVFYEGKKYIINHKVVDKRTVTFDDEFYRFNAMYSFDDQVEATNLNKENYLKKSWQY